MRTQLGRAEIERDNKRPAWRPSPITRRIFSPSGRSLIRLALTPCCQCRTGGRHKDFLAARHEGMGAQAIVLRRDSARQTESVRPMEP